MSVSPWRCWPWEGIIPLSARPLQHQGKPIPLKTLSKSVGPWRRYTQTPPFPTISTRNYLLLSITWWGAVRALPIALLARPPGRAHRTVDETRSRSLKKAPVQVPVRSFWTSLDDRQLPSTAPMRSTNTEAACLTGGQETRR